MDTFLHIVAWTELAFFALGFIMVPFNFGHVSETEWTPGYWLVKYIIFGFVTLALPLRILGVI